MRTESQAMSDSRVSEGFDLWLVVYVYRLVLVARNNFLVFLSNL